LSSSTDQGGGKRRTICGPIPRSFINFCRAVYLSLSGGAAAEARMNWQVSGQAYSGIANVFL
jgi:hypothetical protein